MLVVFVLVVGIGADDGGSCTGGVGDGGGGVGGALGVGRVCACRDCDTDVGGGAMFYWC